MRDTVPPLRRSAVRFTLTPPSRATAPPGGSRGATGGRALPVSASCGRSCVLSRDELGPELLHEHQPRNGDGVRYSCPAKVGKLACTACPLSQHLPPEVTRVTAPEVARPDGTTGTRKVCNSSVTVPLAVLGKHHQKHRWGSREWRRSYDRRIRVEQSFGSLKGHTNGIIRPGWTLQVGTVKTSLLLGVAVAAHNLTTLLNWARKTRWTLDPLTLIVIPTSDDIHDPDPGTGASSPAQPGAPPTA